MFDHQRYSSYQHILYSKIDHADLKSFCMTIIWAAEKQLWEPHEVQLSDQAKWSFSELYSRGANQLRTNSKSDNILVEVLIRSKEYSAEVQIG